VAPLDLDACIELLHDPTTADSSLDQSVVIGRSCVEDADRDEIDLRLLEAHISCGFNSFGDSRGTTAPAQPLRFTLSEFTALTRALTVADADGPVKVSIKLSPSPGDADQRRDDVSVTAVGADGVTRKGLDVGALLFDDAGASSTGGLGDALGQSFEEVYPDLAIAFDDEALISLQQDLGFCRDPESGDDCLDWCVHVAQFAGSEAGLAESATLRPTSIQIVSLWDRSPQVHPQTGLTDEDGWFGVRTLFAALDGFTTSGRPSAGSMTRTGGALTRFASPNRVRAQRGEVENRRSDTVRTPAPDERRPIHKLP